VVHIWVLLRVTPWWLLLNGIYELTILERGKELFKKRGAM